MSDNLSGTVAVHGARLDTLEAAHTDTEARVRMLEATSNRVIGALALASIVIPVLTAFSTAFLTRFVLK